MNKKECLKLIIDAIKSLIKNDENLIERKLKEECINHRLALYLEQLINNSLNLSVDLEYDKNLENSKVICSKLNSKIKIRPDILIHQRNSNANNLIAIECKKGYLNKHDFHKLIELGKSPYKYTLPIGISYQPEKNYLLLYYFEGDKKNRIKLNKKDFSLDPEMTF